MTRSKVTLRFHTTTLGDALHGGPPDCPACGAELDIQQPDPADPDRLLWVCAECRSWFLVYQAADGPAVIVTLPAVAEPAAARRLARA
jgi:uncharacterized protein (DUF983 family)